jgi:hypothetical protein
VAAEEKEVAEADSNDNEQRLGPSTGLAPSSSSSDADVSCLTLIAVGVGVSPMVRILFYVLPSILVHGGLFVSLTHLLLLACIL